MAARIRCEVRLFTERATIGLDVHARSPVAAAIDGFTDEFVQERLTPLFGHSERGPKDCLGRLP